MTRPDACSEAEWMLETIIDDFALSMSLPHRAMFYARLVELLVRRRDQTERAANEPGSEPDIPDQVH